MYGSTVQRLPDVRHEVLGGFRCRFLFPQPRQRCAEAVMRDPREISRQLRSQERFGMLLDPFDLIRQDQKQASKRLKFTVDLVGTQFPIQMLHGALVLLSA